MKKIPFVCIIALSISISAQAQLGRKLKNKLGEIVDKTATPTTTKDSPADNAPVKKPVATAKPIEKPREWFTPVATEIDRPSGIGIDSRDNIYVSDREGIAIITPAGETKRIQASGFAQIVFLRDGQILINNRSSFRKLVQNDQGQYRTEHYAGDINYNGAGDGALFDAKFNDISAVVVGKNGDIFVMDRAWMMLRELKDKNGGVVMEPGVPARLNDDGYWSCIRKISGDKVSTLKNPEGKVYLLMNVAGFTLDDQDNPIYNGGGFSRAIKKIDLATGKWSIVAGKPYKRDKCPVYVTGDTSKAELFSPEFMLRDRQGGIIYADARSHRITRVAGGKVSTVAGNGMIQECSANVGGRAVEGYKDGKALTALFNFPKQMAYDSKGNLFIVDSKNSVIRKLSPDGQVSTITKFDLSKADLPKQK